MSLMELTCNMPFNLCFVSSKFCSEVSSLWFYFIRNVFNLVIQETNNFTKEDVEAYKYALSQSGCSGPINYYREALSSDLPRGHTRTKIKAPTLVVWGTGDIYLMKETLIGTEQYVENLTIK
ncbi:epoxide hydrolase 1-like [Orbicella faveolata]|uniref:epoxide hydrolase 1-like n=1 Tax=Orbicella faveolata TaxID=48498 RepID=UPI0009E4E195|nr:epoxide hydrolase 1-like [Orbicella faveolata]